MSRSQPSISDLVRWIGLLQGGADKISSEPEARDAEEFQAELRQVADNLRDHPENQAEIGSAFLQLVNRYEHANRWLLESDPQYKRLQAGEEYGLDSAQAGSAASAGSATESSSVAPPPTSATMAATQADITGEPEASTEPRMASDDSDMHQSHAASGAAEGLDDMPKRTGKHPWTPELKMQFFKEAFTALLALVIIGVTTVIALRSFNMAGDTKKMGDAKDLLTIMLGVAGVVVGYYFGRMPSDARAAQATSRADEAVSQSEHMKARAKGLADDMDDAMTESTPTATHNGQPSADQSQLRTIRDKLRDMAGST